MPDSGTPVRTRGTLRDSVGICQWFHYEAYADVERAVLLMEELGVRHLRTGISWADYHRPQGRAWYEWQMKALAGFDVLLSVWHTPPSISERGTCASPPRRLDDYGDFVREITGTFGDTFSTLELWNEPNNRIKWNFADCDPEWSKFGRMVRRAGEVAGELGVHRVLGGMIPADHHWLALMRKYSVLEHMDAVAIHGFPEMWWSGHRNWDWHSHWHGWRRKVGYVAEHSHGLPVWITETGLATWDVHERREARHDLQTERLRAAAAAPAERVYWYCLVDLDPARDAIEGFHVDENEYHLGLVRYDGGVKPAWHAMKALLSEPAPASRRASAAGHLSAPGK
jgi:CDP-paratose 2-epimerase